jgi:hypothetical protein
MRSRIRGRWSSACAVPTLNRRTKVAVGSGGQQRVGARVRKKGCVEKGRQSVRQACVLVVSGCEDRSIRGRHIAVGFPFPRGFFPTSEIVQHPMATMFSFLRH